jgi:hypothetical protein
VEELRGRAPEDLEEQNGPLFRAIKIWWKNYEAEPRASVKNTPFKNASNVVIPLIKIMSDSLSARSMSAMFGKGHRYVAAVTENENNVSMANNLARGFNWAAQGNDFHFLPVIYDWLGELFPLGSSVIACGYRRDIRPVFYGSGITEETRANPKHHQVEFSRGVFFENSPRENYLWDTNFEIGHAPVVVRKHSYSWSQLNTMALFDKAWRKEAIESIRGKGDVYSGSASDEIARAKAASDGRGEERADHRAPHDVREIHIDWPILGRLGLQKFGDEDLGTPNLPIVIHYHPKTRTVLRIVAEPYHLPHKPFFDGFFRKRTGRGHSIGVAKDLEMLQSVQTTLFNQAIDSRTRANAMWAKTTDARLLKTPLDPSHPILVNTMDDLELLTTPTQEFSDLSLINAANIVAERLIGQSDPAMGRETRHGGHPSPATSTLALLEQSGIMSSGTDLMLRDKVTQMAQAWAILTQQFETNEDGKLQRTFGVEDAAEMERFLFPTEPIPGNYQFKLVAMSASLNPDAEMSRAVTVAGMLNNYWGFVLRGIQAIENPQVGPMLKAGWTQAIESATSIYSKFLEAANVDDMEKFLAELNKFGPDSAQQLGQFAGGVREMAAAQGSVAPAGNGGLAPGNAAGAGAPNAGLGLFPQ